MGPCSGTALVTGGRGFLGRAIVAELRRAAWRAVTIGPMRACDSDDHHAIARPADEAGIAAALSALRPALVLHLAAAPPSAPADEQDAVTVAGAEALLAALARTGQAPRLLAFGSAAEFGAVAEDAGRLTEAHPCAPVSAYARAKHAASSAVLRRLRDGAMPGAVLRLFTAAGPGAPSGMLLGRVAAEIAAMPSSGGVVRVAGPERERDYLPVAEIARLVVALAQPGLRLPPLLNLCSGRGIAVRDWIAALAAARDVPVSVAARQDGQRAADPPRVIGDNGLLCGLGLAPAAFDLHDLAREIMAA